MVSQLAWTVGACGVLTLPGLLARGASADRQKVRLPAVSGGNEYEVPKRLSEMAQYGQYPM
jgi:hypothetical protein